MSTSAERKGHIGPSAEVAKVDETNLGERQRLLDRLEDEELNRLKKELQGLLDPHSVDKVLASLHAIINRRVIEGLKPTISELGETIGKRFGDFLHGKAGPYYVGECSYGDWVQLATGTAWLEPRVRFRLHFAGKGRLEFSFEPDGEENAVDLRGESNRVACIVLGFQTVSRFAPVEIELANGDKSAESMLIHMHLNQTWTGSKDPVLRVDYAVFHKKVDLNDE